MMSYCLKNTYFLQHHDAYTLLGVSAYQDIYAEAFDDDVITLYHMRDDAVLTIKEMPNIALYEPASSSQTQALNFAGARWRGLQAEDRIQDTTLPLSIQEKMQIVTQFKLDIMPPYIIGIAESYVVSDVALIPDQTYLVCRRLRIAYQLMKPQQDESLQPYDYDTMTVHLAQLYDLNEDISLGDIRNQLWGVNLTKPLDCVKYEDKLVLLDGGSVHVWEGKLVCGNG